MISHLGLALNLFNLGLAAKFKHIYSDYVMAVITISYFFYNLSFINLLLIC